MELMLGLISPPGTEAHKTLVCSRWPLDISTPRLLAPVRKKFMGQKPVRKSGQELWQFSMPRHAAVRGPSPELERLVDLWYVAGK